MGTDSRGTISDRGGTRVEINIIRKLMPVSNHVAIMLYGAANEGTYLVERFQSTLRSNIDGATLIACKFADFCRKEARKVSGVPAQYTPYFGFVVAGLDRQERKFTVPRCYSLDSGDGFWLGSYPQRYAVEGKSMIALYLFTTYYKEDMQLDELSRLVAGAISETGKIDGDVGGPIRIARIDSEGIKENLPEDVDGYIRDWQNRILQNTT